jgi:hypothetical protein
MTYHYLVRQIKGTAKPELLTGPYQDKAMAWGSLRRIDITKADQEYYTFYLGQITLDSADPIRSTLGTI